MVNDTVKRPVRKKYLASIGAVLLVITITGFAWNSTRINTYYVQIPTRFSTQYLPLISVKIQNNDYLLEVDLGSKYQVTLNRHIINQLDKKNSGTLISRDAMGNSYERAAYLVPLVKIGDLSFSDVIVDEQSDDFIANTTFGASATKDDFENRLGYIGRALLAKRNLLLDFHNSRMFISNDIKRLKSAGYHLENFTQCAFEMGKAGIVLPMDTDMGKIRFCLDTGCTASFIRASFVSHQVPDGKKYGLPFIRTSKFEIGGRDFGAMNLHLLNMTPELSEFDALLGMDFLKNHVVYIDHRDQVVYIGDVRSDEQLTLNFDLPIL
jgi:hypothetical protein